MLEKTLESAYGVKVWYESMEEGSAASTLGDFGPAILMNSSEAPWRRNYNFAHEVFHLITWQSIPPILLTDRTDLRQKIEQLANAFASCLLLPAAAVSVEAGQRIAKGEITYTGLVDLARDFCVSTEALLYRLLNLKVFSRKTVDNLLGDPEFRSIDRCTIADCWQAPLRFLSDL